MSELPRRSKIQTEFWILLVTIIISPLAFGTVELWSLALVQFIVSMGFILFVVNSIKGKRSIRRVPGILPLLILLLYMAIQAVPLPPELLRLLSPAAFDIASTSIYPHSPGKWMPVSVYRRGLILEIFRFASYIGVYVLTVELMTTTRRLKRMAYAVSGFVSFLALLSIIASYTSTHEIMWIRDIPGIGIPFGPYLNHNHYAGFMGMALPLVMGAFLISRPQLSGESIRSRISSSLASSTLNWHVLFGLGAVFIMLSIVLSLSRSGVASMLVSVGALSAVFIRQNRTGRGWIVLLVLFVILSMTWFEVFPLIKRIQVVLDTNGPMLGARKIIASDSIRAASDFILTGGGFGAFEHIYPSYRTLSGTLLVDHAHNDYIEFIVEGGILSSLLVFWFIVSVVKHMLVKLPERRNSSSIIIAYASGAGILYILLHSMTDFNMHVGANGLFFFFMLGLAVAASTASSRRGNHYRGLSYGKRYLYAALLLSLSLGCISTWMNTKMLLASSVYREYRAKSAATLYLATPLDKKRIFERAVSLDGLNPMYRIQLAAAEAEDFEFIKAESNVRIALLGSPLCGLCLQSMASLKDISGEYEAAQRYLTASMRYAPRWTDKYLRYGSWLSSSGKKEDALHVFLDGINAEPGRADLYIERMINSGLTFEMIYANIPQRHEAMLALSRKALSSGHRPMASALLDRTFTAIKSSGGASELDLNSMYWMNIALKRYPQAYAVASEGVARFSRNSNLRTLYARELERIDKREEALDAYRYALALNPSNSTALRGVERLK